MSFVPSNEFYAEVAKGNVAGHSIVAKFGENSALPNGTFELISALSAVYTGFLAVVSTVRIKAGGNAADTAAGAGAQSVFVEGVDSNLVRVTEEIATAGAAASSATSASFWRIDRAYVGDAGTYATPVNTGAVVIEISGGGTDLVQIDAGEGQTQHAHAAIQTGVDIFLLGYELTVDSNQKADFELYVRSNINDVTVPVSAQRIMRHWRGLLNPVTHEFQLPVAFGAGPADVWMEAAGGGGVTAVTASFNLLLVDNI